MINKNFKFTLKELNRLNEIIGSLLITQFKDQEEYRKAIHLILQEFFKKELI